MTLIRGISGIRGIVNQTFDNSVITSHVNEFSQIQNEGTILIARDSRIHGKEFLIVAAKILKESGREVLNCDIIPTPTAQFLIEKYQ